jgi:hypothetical protein
MKKIILTESQVKSVINNFINEQGATVNEFVAETDASKISHAMLSSSFGLPNGAQNETKFYVAQISKVIEQSTKDPKTFLSIFTPYTPVTNDPKDDGDMGGYFDYIEVYQAPGKAGVALETKGTKTFNFVSGLWVAASHNGLLAVKRLMDQMKGKGGVATIGFQTKRNSESVNLNVNAAYNAQPIINTIYFLLSQLSLKNPEKTTYAEYSKKGNNSIIDLLNNIAQNVLTGRGRFVDEAQKDTILPVMAKVKGFVTRENLDIDFTSIGNKLISLQEIEDKDGRGTNPVKVAKITELNNEVNVLLGKLKSGYINNFKLYVSTYLKNSSSQLLPTIDSKVVMTTKNLGETLDYLLNMIRGGQVTNPTPTLQQNKREYQSGT